MNQLFARSGLAQRIVMALACAVIVGMFWTNDDNSGVPDAPRGTGEYLPVLARGDGHMMYLIAQSTALQLDWVFDDELAAFGDPWGQQRSAVGRMEIPHPIGPPLLWTPLIWVAHAGAHAANAFGADIPLHGYTEWHQRFAFLSSVIAAFIAILLGRKVARRVIGGSWSPTYAAIAVLLGTSITYYATYMPSYGHALDAGACGAFLGVWALTVGRSEWRRWLALGALLGLAMLIRVQDVALGIVIVIEVSWMIAGDLRRRAIDWRLRALRWLFGGAIVLAVAIVVFSPQLYYWHVVYGEWLGLPQGSRYTRLGSPMILELLYAPRNGWFSTTPIAYLAVIGLACVPRRARLVALALGAALVIQVYLNSTIIDWWAMASWSQRRLCSVTFVLVFGLAALLWRLGWLVARLPRVPRIVWHVVAVAVLGSMVAWNLWRVGQLSGGKAPPAELAPTCCKRAPKLLRGPLTAIYERIGNPFQFPANVWFAIEHGVEIQRWDHAVGYYALEPSAQSLRSDAMYFEVGEWRIGYPLSDPYLIGRWSEPQMAGRQSSRWTLSPSVTALVPNLMPYPQRMQLGIAPGGARDVTVRWDGEVVARGELNDGWQWITFDIYDMDVGEHELTIEATPAPFAGNAEWPTPSRPVGVAVSRLVVNLIRP